MPVTGGDTITVSQIKGPPNGGAFWAADDTVVFMNGDRSAGLQRVRSNGGEPITFTRPDPAQREGWHYYPHVLPDGSAILFTVVPSGSGPNQIAALDVRTGARRIVARGSQAAYVSPGYLIYAVGGTLWAAAFDRRTLSIVETPVPVLEGVRTIAGGSGADFSVSTEGTLVYVPESAQAAPRRTMMWVDRQGHEEAIAAPSRPYIYPRLSPDAKRVAVAIADQDNDIWMWDIPRSTLTRFTFNPGFDLYPLWTPDGRRIVWGAASGGSAEAGIYWQWADGTGVAEHLTSGESTQFVSYPVAISPDGTRLVVREDRPETGLDLALLTLDSNRRVTSLIRTSFSDRNAEISPDGRWLAYESTESGREEIYVRPFPSVNNGRWQVSIDGGRQPLWAHNGQELFYRAPDGSVMAVRVRHMAEGSTGFSSDPPSMIVQGKSYFFYSAGLLGRSYDVSADGGRFLMIKERGVTDDAAAHPSIVVVKSWQEELKRLLRLRTN